MIVATGLRTQFGQIASRVTLRRPETEFDRGIRHFGYLLTSVMVTMVLVVFVVHVLSRRPPIDTLLFFNRARGRTESGAAPAITARDVLATELTKHWFYRQPGTIGS